MRQVVQSYKTGEVTLREVPVPLCGNKRILVRNIRSLISIGTERSTIELGRKSLAGKAAARPDLVRRVWEKARKEGLLKTWQEAMGRLDTPTPLGYSCAGLVEECGWLRQIFSGDRVACVGQGCQSCQFVSYLLIWHAGFLRVLLKKRQRLGCWALLRCTGFVLRNLALAPRSLCWALGCLVC